MRSAASPEVSVVTAVHNPEPAHLLEAYGSLRRQEEVSLEWVIQMDGPLDSDQIPPAIRGDQGVAIGANGEELGPEATRDLGLLRCSSELVLCLEAEDRLVVNSLLTLVDSIRDEGVAFASGQALWFSEDGLVEEWEPAPANGTEPATIVQEWSDSMKYHPAGSRFATLWKSVYVHAYGGLQSGRGTDEIHLMNEVANDHAGVYLERPITLMRVQDQQTENKALRTARRLAKRALSGEILTGADYIYDLPDGKQAELPLRFNLK